MKKIKPTDKELLELIKWYAEENITFNKGKTFEEFQTTTQLNWASVFSIEQIAENSKQVSDEVKNRYPNFPWREIVRIRNIIAHNYDGVHMDIVWNVVKDYLPEMVEKLTSILENDKELLISDELIEDRYEFKNTAKFKSNENSENE